MCLMNNKDISILMASPATGKVFRRKHLGNESIFRHWHGGTYDTGMVPLLWYHPAMVPECTDGHYLAIYFSCRFGSD